MKVVNLLGREDTREVLKTAVRESEPEVIGISVRNIDDQCMEPSVFLLERIKGVPKRELKERSLGHDLERALKKAILLGFDKIGSISDHQ